MIILSNRELVQRAIARGDITVTPPLSALSRAEASYWTSARRAEQAERVRQAAAKRRAAEGAEQLRRMDERQQSA